MLEIFDVGIQYRLLLNNVADERKDVCNFLTARKMCLPLYRKALYE